MITTNLVLSVLLATNNMQEIELRPVFERVLAKRCGFCQSWHDHSKAVKERGNLLYYIPVPNDGECTCVYTNGRVTHYYLVPKPKVGAVRVNIDTRENEVFDGTNWVKYVSQTGDYYN